MRSDDDLARAVLHACRTRGVMVATAESCTGGLIAAALTEIPGSSDVVDRGYVVYSNRAKIEMLGVSAEMLATHGAVSAPVAAALAEGARARAGVGLTVAVTGIAGPGGATAQKPVGLVHLACASAWAPLSAEQAVFPGDRSAIRAATVRQALTMLLRQLAHA
jgi:nicotinamide-nucleotide amidase